MKVVCAGVLRLCCHTCIGKMSLQKQARRWCLICTGSLQSVRIAAACFFSLQVPTDGFSEETTVSETTGSFHEWLRCYLHPFHSQKHVSSCQHASSYAEEVLLLFLKERMVVGKIRLFPLKVMFCLFTPEFFWWYKTGRVLFTAELHLLWPEEVLGDVFCFYSCGFTQLVDGLMEYLHTRIFAQTHVWWFLINAESRGRTHSFLVCPLL